MCSIFAWENGIDIGNSSFIQKYTSISFRSLIASNIKDTIYEYDPLFHIKNVS